MRVLIAAASKHGATAEIAVHIGEALRSRGLDSDVLDLRDDPDPAGYTAAILGSGVYAGQWLKPARRYIDRHGPALTALSVWLFSSGPLGNPLKPDDEEAVKADGLVAATAAREHRLFAGALDSGKLSFGEKAIVKAVRAPDGDYRDWAAIDAWAEEIAAQLAK